MSRTWKTDPVHLRQARYLGEVEVWHDSVGVWVEKFGEFRGAVAKRILVEDFKGHTPDGLDVDMWYGGMFPQGGCGRFCHVCKGDWVGYPNRSPRRSVSDSLGRSVSEVNALLRSGVGVDELDDSLVGSDMPDDMAHLYSTDGHSGCRYSGVL